MTATQNILDAYQAKLIADQSAGSLYAKLGGRIYHMIAAHDDALPLLVWDVVSNPLDKYFDGKFEHLVTVRNSIWVDRRVDLSGGSGGGQLEDDLFDLMEGFDLTVSGFDRGQVLFINRGVRSVVGDAVVVQSDATIRATTT